MDCRTRERPLRATPEEKLNINTTALPKQDTVWQTKLERVGSIKQHHSNSLSCIYLLRLIVASPECLAKLILPLWCWCSEYMEVLSHFCSTASLQLPTPITPDLQEVDTIDWKYERPPPPPFSLSYFPTLHLPLDDNNSLLYTVKKKGCSHSSDTCRDSALCTVSPQDCTRAHWVFSIHVKTEPEQYTY